MRAKVTSISADSSIDPLEKTRSPTLADASGEAWCRFETLLILQRNRRRRSDVLLAASGVACFAVLASEACGCLDVAIQQCSRHFVGGCEQLASGRFLNTRVGWPLAFPGLAE